MSIGRIELNGPAPLAYSLPNINTPPRNASEKYLERSNAKREYYAATNRLERANQDQYLKVQASRTADINKINKKGMNAPAPNIKYNKFDNYQQYLYYRNTVGSIIDRTA